MDKRSAALFSTLEKIKHVSILFFFKENRFLRGFNDVDNKYFKNHFIKLFFLIFLVSVSNK